MNHVPIGLICVTLCLAGEVAWAGEVDIPNVFVAGEPAVAADVNENFSALETEVDDNAARVGVVEMQIGDINADIDTVNSEVDTVESSITQLQTSVANIESVISNDLTHIQYLNWQHNGQVSVSDFEVDGMVLWFSGEVLSDSLVPSGVNLVVQLFKYNDSNDTSGGGVWELEEDIDINGVSAVSVDSDSVITTFTVDADPLEDTVMGIQLVRTNNFDVLGFPGLYKIVIKGDFIVDEVGRSLDGNFLRGQVPTGDRIEGGTFESWFTVSL